MTIILVILLVIVISIYIFDRIRTDKYIDWLKKDYQQWGMKVKFVDKQLVFEGGYSWGGLGDMKKELEYMKRISTQMGMKQSECIINWCLDSIRGDEEMLSLLIFMLQQEAGSYK